MQRTNTTTYSLFALPAPKSAIFDFSAPNEIRITIPKSSKWQVESHWHSADHENCLLLHVESGQFQVAYRKEPRTGGLLLGTGDYKFKPEYWTSWSRKQSLNTETVVRLYVRSEGFQRNVCSAILDSEKFPYLATTPWWLRGVFAALRVMPTVRNWLVGKMCYVQLQVIYREHRYWVYHGGINALRWWQWAHPFDIGSHPAWTARVQYRSQKLFSQVVQGIYYWIGTSLLGMRGDYPEYNPQFEDGLKTKNG